MNIIAKITSGASLVGAMFCGFFAILQLVFGSLGKFIILLGMMVAFVLAAVGLVKMTESKG